MGQTDGRPENMMPLAKAASGHGCRRRGGIKTPEEGVCQCFCGEINIAQRLWRLLLDHIIEEATGAAGNTSSTEGHKQKKREALKKEEKQSERQAGGW